MPVSRKGTDESLNEFAADDGNGGEDDALRNYAKMWWAGDEATQMQIERALAKMGWEIGEDEGGYDNGGVFVVRTGDENGNSYQSWAAEDLTEGLTEVDRRGFLRGLGAAAVAGAAGGATTKANAQEITKWVNYATNLATKTMGGRIHQDTGYDLRNWLVVNVSNWVTDYCNKTNSFNAQTVIDYCNQQGVEAAGLDKQNALVTAFLTNMKNRYQDFLSAYRAGINEAIQTYYRINQSKQQEKNAMGNLGKEEFDVLIDALIVYAICKDRQLDNSDLFKAVAASIKRFIDANNAKDYVNSIYPKAKQSVEVLKNNPELYQKESAQFFKNAGSTIEKLDRLSSNKKPEFESVEPGVAEGDLNEFARSGNGDDDDRGEDPYGRPEPKHYARSVDYFGRFEADHFDKEHMDDATGVFKGYWDYDGDMKQIAYFKFDDPARTGSDDPGMGWYYEPQNESVAEGIDDEEYGPELAALKKEFGKFTQHYDRMDQDSAYAAKWRKQNTDRLNQQGSDDEDMMGDIGAEMGQDDENSMREGKPKEKEADYGADYQDMVSRVKKLAGLGPLRTVYDPQKRVYKNVPRAVQPKKEQR
jgi:hypothetical protein